MRQLKSNTQQQHQRNIRKCAVSVIALLLISGHKCPFGCNGWDPDYIVDRFLPICKLAQTQEMIWFLSETLDATSWTRVQQFIVLMQNSLGITQMVFTNRTDLRIVHTESKKNYIGLIFTTGPHDPIMLVHDRVLIGRHFGLNVIVLAQQCDDYAIIAQFVEGMHRRNFQNSMLYLQNTNGTNALWGYAMYPKFAVQNRTDLFAYLMEHMHSIRNAELNTLGFEFRTPLRQDLPYGFFARNATSQLQRYGTSYKMIELFIDYINASLLDYVMPKDSHGGDIMDMKAALNLVRANEVPFLAHAYALYASDDEVDKSYPLMVVKWCLMVPIWNSVSTYFYPIQPFDFVVWLLFIGTFLILVVAELLLAIRSHFQHRYAALWSFVDLFGILILHDFCFVLNISTGSTLRLPKSMLRAVLLLTVFFFGFFLSANYSAVLGSILTVNLFRENINSMEDLIRANITVMIIDYELEFLLAGGNDLSAEFLNLLLPVDAATFNRHQLALNASYAYFVTDDKWHFIQLQQTYLKQGIFKFTDICFGSHLLVFPVRPDSPIWRNLEYYIFRMHSSGMLQYYESTSFDYAVHAGLMTRLTEANEYTSAGLEHLFMVFMLLLLVSVFSIFIFIGELILEWYVKQRRQKN